MTATVKESEATREGGFAFWEKGKEKRGFLWILIKERGWCKVEASTKYPFWY